MLVLVCLNVYRKIRKRTDIAFHPEVFRVSLFIFSQGMARLCKVYLLSCITMTRMSKMKTTDYTGVSDI